MISQMRKTLTFWDYDDVTISTFLKVPIYFHSNLYLFIATYIYSYRSSRQFTLVLCYCTIAVIELYGFCTS